jgi:hypothetical protein
MAETTHFLGYLVEDNVHQQVTRKRLLANLENSMLSNLGDESANGSCARMAIGVVKFPPRLRRQKSVPAADLYQLVDKGAQHIDKVVWRVLMLRVHFEGLQETSNGLLKLAFPQVQKPQIAVSRGILRADL